jgi:hypothetical protein
MGVQRLYLRGNRIAIFTRKGVFLNSCKQSFIPGKKTCGETEGLRKWEGENGEPAETIVRLLERERDRLTFIAVGLDRFA